jgi:lysophospholipase L1-like esterase
VPGGTYKWAGVAKHTKDECNRWRTQRASEIAQIQPDVVLVIYGSFDMLDRKWDGSDTWTHVGLPDFDRALAQDIGDMTDLLGSGGAHVIWATYPRIRTGVVDGKVPLKDFPEYSHDRADRLNTLIREAVAQRPFASVLELRRHLQAWPNGELDGVKRPDGVHPNAIEAVNIADWIGDQLVTDPTLR